MKTIELTYPHSYDLAELPDTVCAIGFFDGIHKGHQSVIKKAVVEAKKKKMESAVITFYPHPSVILKKDTERVRYITPIKEKKKVLQDLHIDRLYIIKFNKDLASLSPQDFIDHFIVGLNIKHLVAGFDFSYGHKGKGNMETMDSLANGSFTHTTISKVELDKEKISSTRIRELLKDGNVTGANRLLGRPLTIEGIVVKGDQRGRTIGYPTANLEVNPDALLPKAGVYAVKIRYNGDVFEGMANLGIKPTFNTGNTEPSVEVNIFDYNNNLYGEALVIEWHCYIRDEKKFNGVESLIRQLASDEKSVRNYFTASDK
ncbi:riboflavin biosynthesis protein RibF [Virgibacillus sp. C22-A2]|uniref:Riboflavin biosynthesis protein n=1 Tax=Virgibacillus tibetensis TaxID=3042313 RepID=A0ABU6KBX8_9BACI|nr:riboflavin biosynthesis protein RibF [Virgibacillus sp. C22-A2]